MEVDPQLEAELVAERDAPPPEQEGALTSGTEFTTADNYDPKVKASAYELFLTTDNTYADIALTLGIDARVVTLWARRGKWVDQRNKLELALLEDAESKYRQLVIQHKIPVLRRHLAQAEKIDAITDKLADTVTELISDGDVDLQALKRINKASMVLKRLAETMASSSGVSARAAAIDERPGLGDEKGKQKQPLILLNVQPQAQETSTPLKVEAIDVTDGQTPASEPPSADQ